MVAYNDGTTIVMREGSEGEAAVKTPGSLQGIGHHVESGSRLGLLDESVCRAGGESGPFHGCHLDVDSGSAHGVVGTMAATGECHGRRVLVCPTLRKGIARPGLAIHDV